MVCRKGEDVLVKSTVVVAKISVYLGLTRYVNLKIAYGVYMDPVIPFDQFAQRPALCPFRGTGGVGRDNATLREPTPSHKNCLKRARRPQGRQSHHHKPGAFRGLGAFVRFEIMSTPSAFGSLKTFSLKCSNVLIINITIL
jgi:hypothetical protein